jgi:hypothetical protein
VWKRPGMYQRKARPKALRWQMHSGGQPQRSPFGLWRRWSRFTLGVYVATLGVRLATWRQLRELVGLAPPHHFGDVRSAPSPAPSTPVAKTRLTGTTTRQRDFEPCRASASAQPWSPSTREEVHFGVSVTGSKTTISTRTVKEWRLRWPISTSSRSRVIDLAERFADMTDAAHGKGNRVIHTQDQKGHEPGQGASF